MEQNHLAFASVVTQFQTEIWRHGHLYSPGRFALETFDLLVNFFDVPLENAIVIVRRRLRSAGVFGLRSTVYELQHLYRLGALSDMRYICAGPLHVCAVCAQADVKPQCCTSESMAVKTDYVCNVCFQEFAVEACTRLGNCGSAIDWDQYYCWQRCCERTQVVVKSEAAPDWMMQLECVD